MRLIPVIDLMGGVVVHAKKGQRDNYQPIQSPLCKGPDPIAVIEGLLALHPFDTVYVADLDALTGRGNHRNELEGLQQAYPNLRFWVDQGLDKPVGKALPVVGSESLGEEGLAVLPWLGDEFILSLDFMGKCLLGPGKALEEPGTWPETVIIMSLCRVGSGKGPDFQRLEKFCSHWPGKRIIAAGGVRHAVDLRRLDEMGISGVLLASALHSGALEASVLREFDESGRRVAPVKGQRFLPA